MTEQLKLSDYGCFLVCDDSLANYDSEFINWLRANGFKSTPYSVNWRCNWAFVNMKQKLYALGRPGVSYAQVVYDHAITIEEFKIIYGIFSKYEGKETFVFYKERFDYDRQK